MIWPDCGSNCRGDGSSDADGLAGSRAARPDHRVGRRSSAGRTGQARREHDSDRVGSGSRARSACWSAAVVVGGAVVVGPVDAARIASASSDHLLQSSAGDRGLRDRGERRVGGTWSSVEGTPASCPIGRGVVVAVDVVGIDAVVSASRGRRAWSAGRLGPEVVGDGHGSVVVVDPPSPTATVVVSSPPAATPIATPMTSAAAAPRAVRAHQAAPPGRRDPVADGAGSDPSSSGCTLRPSAATASCTRRAHRRGRVVGRSSVMPAPPDARPARRGRGARGS